MTDFLLGLFAVLVIAPLLKIMGKPERIYRYPYFMTVVFGIFILPQAVSLIRFPEAASEEVLQRLLLVTCLCLGACLVRYRFSLPFRVGGLGAVNHGRLFHAGIAFVASGIGFSYLLSHTVVQTTEFGGWTGPATIYGFFQQLCYPGFAICLMLALRRPTLLTVLSIVVSAIVPIQSIFFGRREPAALFLLTVGLTLYFRTRVVPPRWLIISLGVGAMFLIPATGTYRRFQLQDDWQSVRQLDVVGNFKDFLDEDSVLELRNAAMLIEATRRSGEYEYGAGYWNHLMFRYVPAQLLGQSFKASLMISRSRDGLERELAAMDYINPPGSTVTAMGDSFQQFGYLGCLFFAVLGAFFHYLWRAALSPSALFAQLLYMQSCTCAMRAVTHWTLDFLPGLLYNLLFLGAAVFYASTERPKVATGSSGRAAGRWKAAPHRQPGKASLQGLPDSGSG
jgi:hypothetical protein